MASIGSQILKAAIFEIGKRRLEVVNDPTLLLCRYVEISVYARNWFTRDDLIGSCSLQLASVNNRKNHIYAKKWMVQLAQY